jgi:hypothetical protein
MVNVASARLSAEEYFEVAKGKTGLDQYEKHGKDGTGISLYQWCLSLFCE